MVKWDGLITIAVLLFIIFLVYSKMKKQTLKESFEEIKDLLIGGKKDG